MMFPGSTALMVAVRRKADGVAKLLVLAGADVNASDDEGRSPLWHAICSGDPHLCALLLSHGASRAPACFLREAPPSDPPAARPLHAFLTAAFSRGWGRWAELAPRRTLEAAPR